MPSTPTYVHRLQAGIEALEAGATEWVDRRSVEEALGVSKCTAWRILKRCGAQEGPGGSLICRREEFLQELRNLKEDGRFKPEIARRDRVERYLDSILQYASRKQKKIARNREAVELLSSRFSNLPPGVDLKREELRIAFSGTQDFLQKVGSIVFALSNDLEEITEFLD